MGKSIEFEKLRAMLDSNPNITQKTLSSMQSSKIGHEALNGFALMAGWHYRDGRPDKALKVLNNAANHFALTPIPLLALRTHAIQLMGKHSEVALEYVDYGRKAIELGLWELGLEAISTALVVDISRGYHKLLHDTNSLLTITRLYEKIAQIMRPPEPSILPESSDRIRIGMIVPNMVDNTVAYSNRIMFFARYIDSSKYDLRVYITENTNMGSYRLPVSFKSPPTEARAPAYLNELKERNIPVFLPDISSGILKRSSQIAKKISDDNIDALILQAGPSMPVDWLACRLAEVPIKLQIHIGLSAFQEGIDATLFDNSVNMERESALWPEYAGDMILMRRGTDIEKIDQSETASRESLRIPEDAVLIGTLSNHFNTRMSDECFDCICSVLKSNNNAYYMGVGGKGSSERLTDIAKKHGVSERVKLLPSTRNAAPLLKIFDIYANEFPSGGSQSVIEAMVCGLPVVAMRAGNTHHESVGSDIVGAPYAIETYDKDAYRDLLNACVSDPLYRSEVGLAMRKRGLAEFSIRTYVRNVCDLAQNRLLTKYKEQLAIA